MNLTKLSFLFVFALLIAACGDDDDAVATCTQSNWVGTYMGTIDCDGTTEDVTVTITSSGSAAVIIKYETSVTQTEYDPLTPDGCDIDKMDSGAGITVTIDATLNGDNLTIQEVLAFNGAAATCNITATRS